jgi:all-trans-8'-apo-beta-carotenal 15,15'-oxygenase
MPEALENLAVESETRGWPWSPGFESLADEFDYRVEEIQGAIPPLLRGTLFRNGSGRNALGNRWFPHWFDGDGMVCAIAFTDSGVHFRNRFVRTQSYLDESRTGRIMHRGFGKMRPGGALANAFRLPANVANISVVLHGGRFFALWEGGPPTQLDPGDLTTIGQERFGGQVRAFCAHPRIDPATGELFGFGIDYGLTSTLTPYRIDPSGRLARYPAIRLPYPVMNHDFVLTGRYLVFCLGPVVLNPLSMLLGFSSFDGALKWDAGRPTLVLIVPRDGAVKPKWLETEPFFQFHFAGGYDDGEFVVLDAARYDDFITIGGALRAYRYSDWPAKGMAALTRLVVDADSGKVEGRPFQAGNANEFPRVDPRRTAARHRYVYMLSNPPHMEHGLQQLVTRLDVETGVAASHDFGPHGYPGEAVFIPYRDHGPEDEGCVVTLVFDAASRRTDVVGLDARDVSGRPLFVARLKHHVPFGLHGFFTPELFGRDRLKEQGG